MNNKEFLTPKEAAAYVNMSTWWLWYAREKYPDFPKPRRKSARRLEYVRSELDEWRLNNPLVA